MSTSSSGVSTPTTPSPYCSDSDRNSRPASSLDEKHLRKRMGLKKIDHAIHKILHQIKNLFEKQYQENTGQSFKKMETLVVTIEDRSCETSSEASSDSDSLPDQIKKNENCDVLRQLWSRERHNIIKKNFKQISLRDVRDQCFGLLYRVLRENDENDQAIKSLKKIEDERVKDDAIFKEIDSLLNHSQNNLTSEERIKVIETVKDRITWIKGVYKKSQALEILCKSEVTAHRYLEALSLAKEIEIIHIQDAVLKYILMHIVIPQVNLKIRDLIACIKLMDERLKKTREFRTRAYLCEAT